MLDWCYHDFANVEIKGVTFRPITTFDRAIRSFRDAVYRYGMKMKILYASRKYTTLKGTAPKEARERYPNLITISTEGSFALTTEFQRALDQSKDDVEEYQRQRALTESRNNTGRN